MDLKIPNTKWPSFCSGFILLNILCSASEGDRPWLPHLPSPSVSRVSSPASSRTSGSPLVDSPGSPSTVGMAADAVPYNVGVDEDHPYACTLCDKAFQRPSFLKKHEQVR